MPQHHRQPPTPPGESPQQDAPGKDPGAVRVGRRDRTYLVAKEDRIDPLTAGPLDFDWIVEQLENHPDAVVERTLDPRGLSLQSTGPSLTRKIVVASMTDELAQDLRSHPQVVVEEDRPVVPVPAPAPPLADHRAVSVSPFGTSSTWELQLQSADAVPVTGATVYLYGSTYPAQGRTDAAGRVTLSLLNESDDTLTALYVNPQGDCWSLWLDRPSLISGVVNLVLLDRLEQRFAPFPRGELTGWGQAAMRLHEVPADLDGRGVSVAVIDSGAAADTHRDLRAITHGIDVTTSPAQMDTWTVDTIAHGSHCSGIIAGAVGTGGIRGFAPAAQLHEARIFPGGTLSSLLHALDYCIEQQVDVVNMSLGTGGTSAVVLQKLAEARQQGVACIVAAGNSGDGVQFPGSSPDVLTVAAIGRDGEFPESSYHARQRWVGGTSQDSYFSAQFSCHGPEVDVCGPGVAIVSSVPPDDFAAWDGTSMATPHVAGLAALVLAHHSDFTQEPWTARSAARVDHLFEILRSSALPLHLGDPERTGAGLPDALRALGLDGPAPPPASSTPALTEAVARVRRALLEVRTQLEATGLRDD